MRKQDPKLISSRPNSAKKSAKGYKFDKFAKIKFVIVVFILFLAILVGYKYFEKKELNKPWCAKGDKTVLYPTEKNRCKDLFDDFIC